MKLTTTILVLATLASGCTSATSDLDTGDGGTASDVLDAEPASSFDAEPTFPCQETPDGGVSGAVVLDQYPGRVLHVSPYFPFVIPWYPPPYACTARCRLTYGVVGDASVAPDADHPRSFGTLTVTGLATGDYVATPGSGGVVPLDGSVAWRGGEQLGIEATGDPNDVAAFAGELVGPTPVALAAVPSTQRRSAPLVLTWSTGGASPSGLVRFVIDGPSTNPNPWNRTHAVCLFPVSDGQGVVSTTVLGELAASSAAYWTADVYAATATTSADGPVHLEASVNLGTGSIQLE